MKSQQEFEQEMQEEMEDLTEEQQEDSIEDSEISRREIQEAYGYPEAEPTFNQHTFLANSIKEKETEKVTFLQVEELGRPLFSVRFMLDIEDIARHYLDEITLELGLDNKIAKYFREKINNVCSSGMSNKGFIQNMNVTRKMDTTRKRVKPPIEVKGGN